MSQIEERNRISRDIHDSIGHRLTGVLMQVEACIRYYDVDSSKSRELANSVRDNLRDCSEVLRHTVKGLKPKDYQDSIVSMQEMVYKFEKLTGVNISFEIEGIRCKLNKAIEITLYKNVQEALTNAIRHGKATKIKIELKFEVENVCLTISDIGVGSDEIIMGMGISGMEERARILGGKLEMQSRNGFFIKTTIPINAKQEM